MTVTIRAREHATFLLFLPILLGDCTSENAAVSGPEETTSDLPETTGDVPTPTTGSEPDNGTTTGESSSSTGSPEASTGLAPPSCGDGVVEGEEQCDDGLENAKDAACLPNCTLAYCGDGLVQAGVEECDAFFGENTTDGACLPTCVLARCGDGFVQAGVEECDQGEANKFKYGGCVPITCKWAPRCGDGQIDGPDEVCDPGDPNGQGDDFVPCEADCRFKARIVFLTSGTYDGKLGGLMGADAICQGLAATFDKERADSYIAWLSDAETSPLDRIKHDGELASTPYVLRNGVAVAASFDDLVTNGPGPGIDLTDKYESLLERLVWTNTASDGGRFSASDHCGDWGSNSSDYSARMGMNRLPEDSLDFPDWEKFGFWTSQLPKTCDLKYRLYCFEN